MKYIVNCLKYALNITLVLFVLLSVNGCKKKNENSVDKFWDKEDRILSIVNNTEEVIDKLCVLIGEGTEVANIINPDDKNIQINITGKLDEYDEFTIVLIDGYERIYRKNVSNIKIEGLTEIVVSKNDRIKTDGDIWKDLYDLLNEIGK